MASNRDEKILLHDGVQQVTRISIMAMFRNNAPYLEYFLKQMDAWESAYDVAFSYYFIENDSEDATLDKLKAFFASGKPGKLLSGHLEKDYVNRGENFERCYTLGRLRNTLADAITPLDTQWTIFIDSNIFFPVDVLQRFFAIEPKKNDIGMITPYTNQVFTLGQLQRIFNNSLNIGDDNKDPMRKLNINHAFDTFTFVSEDYANYYPYCPFKRCQFCRSTRPSDFPYPMIEPDQTIIDVRSAFGGFAAIDTEAINHPRIRWGSLPFDHKGNQSLSDHVLFCDRLQTVTGKRVVLLQNVDNLMREY
jgi:hypothetical protein